MRALVRAEGREIRRHPVRSWLVVLLVAVPAGAVVVAGTLLGIVEPTPAERAARELGAAELRVAIPAGHADLERARARLPAGARLERLHVGREQVRVAGRRLRARLLAARAEAFADSGLAAGMVRVLEGRLPANPAEAALSPGLLEGLGLARGGTVILAYGPARRIVGVVADPEALDDPLVVRVPALVEDRGGDQLLVGLAPAAAAAAAGRLRADGLAATTRAEAARPDPGPAALVGALGAVGFFEAALVIAAAFMVGVRRRRREIGLLGAAGAPAGTIVAALVLSAVALAAAGAVLGALAGSAVAAAVHPFLDGWNRRWNGPFEPAPWHAAGVLAGGAITAALAAALPARHAARLPIRVALGGRRPGGTPTGGWLAAGMTMTAAAVALLVVPARGAGATAGVALLAASVLGVLGFGASSPWLLERLARLAAPLPPAWRLALRDAGRFRARHGPVVTAVLAGMSMSVTVAALIASVESATAAFPPPVGEDQLVVEGPDAEGIAAQIAVALGAVARAPLAAAYANAMPLLARGGGEGPGARPGWVAAGDEALLRALGGEDAAAAFREGRVVALHPETDLTGARLTVWRDGPRLGWAAFARVARGRPGAEPRFILAADRLEARGLEAGPPPGRSLAPWLVRLPEPVGAPALDRARAIAARSPGVTVDAAPLHRGPARGLYHALLAACVAVGLVVVLVATGLSAAESAADERALHALGAPPALLRRRRAASAGVLALLGCALAVPAGLITAGGLIATADIGLPFVMPWRDVLVVVAGLPALAWLAGGRIGGGVGRVPRGLHALLAAAASATMATGAAGATPAPGGAAAPLPPDPRTTATATAAAAPAIRWEPWTGVAVDGGPIAGDLGRIRVPERRGAANGRTVEIAFVRYRTTNPDPGPPVLYLEGGPGGSGVEGCAFPATHPALRMLEHADVIGVDQRGTGRSRPDLSTPGFSYTLPLDRPLGRAEDVAAFRGAVARAVRHWRARGVDPAAYNTVESADDLDDVRRALGLERVVLYGASYGSHLGLAYLRRHPEHVARAVLLKVEGPDHTWKDPAAVQRALEHLAARAAADPGIRSRLPDLLGTVRGLLDRLARAPVAVELRPGAPDAARIVLGPYDLRCAIARALSRTRTAAALPRDLHRLAAGDWNDLAASALEHRRGTLGTAMGVFVDCASGASPARRAHVRRAAADPANRLGDALAAPFYPEACAPCGDVDLGEAFRGPVACDAPVLFVSGALDPRTPPDNVAEIAAGFPRHAHVVVRGAGHDGREILSEEYRDLLQAFLRGETVRSTTITLPFRLEPIGVESPAGAAVATPRRAASRPR